MKKNNTTLGIICILISGFSFSLMALFVKLAGDIPVMQKSFFRNVMAGSIAIIPVLKHLKTISYPKNNKQWGVLFLRAFFGTVGLICNFYAISAISLSDSSIIQKLSPFVVLILSYFIFNERLTLFQFGIILVAFIGVLFIIKPTMDNLISSGAAVALLGAFLAGGAYTALRYLGLAGVSGEFTILFFSFFSSLSVLPFIMMDYKPMTNYQFVMLVFVGIFGAMGQFGITYAYKFAAAKNLAVFDYAQIIFVGSLGFLFFGEIPDFYSLIGYLIVIFSGIMVVSRK